MSDALRTTEFFVDLCAQATRPLPHRSPHLAHAPASPTASLLEDPTLPAPLHHRGERQLAMMASAGQRRKLTRYSVLYREGAIATCFYVLIGGSVLEQSLAPCWKEPPLKPGHARPKGHRKDRRTHACDRRPGCTFMLIGMEALVGRVRVSAESKHCTLLCPAHAACPSASH